MSFVKPQDLSYFMNTNAKITSKLFLSKDVNQKNFQMIRKYNREFFECWLPLIQNFKDEFTLE